MVTPTFEPGPDRGSSGDIAFQGMRENASWMAQLQQRQLATRRQQMAEEQQQQATALFQIAMPLKMAQARADQAKAENDYAADLQMQKLVAQANVEMPNIRSAWNSTFQMPDQDARLAAQGSIISNAGRYSSLKGISEEIATWKDAYAKSSIDKRTLDAISGRSEVAAMQAQARAELEAQRRDMQKQMEDLKAQHNMERDAAKASTYKNSASFKIREGAASKFNEELVKGAMSANYEKGQAERGLELLDKARTGPAADFENTVKRLGTIFGGDVEGVKNYEQLQGILGNQVFDYIHRTKGAISDKEMATFQNYSANAAKSPEGNKAILRALIKAKERDIELGSLINQMRKDRDSEGDIQNAVVDYQNEHPIFDSSAPAGGGSGVKILSIKKLD